MRCVHCVCEQVGGWGPPLMKPLSQLCLSLSLGTQAVTIYDYEAGEFVASYLRIAMSEAVHTCVPER